MLLPGHHRDMNTTVVSGPLYSSITKVELFDNARSLLSDCGFAAVDMESGILRRKRNIQVVRVCADRCQKGQSTIKPSTKESLRQAAVDNLGKIIMAMES